MTKVLKSNIKEGNLVTSIKGHDSGKVYLVLQISGNFAKCVDGISKLIEKPKNKNIKHLENLNVCYDNLMQKFKDKKLYDFEVKTTIKNEVKMHKI